MKHEYESWSEVGNDFRDGDSHTHRLDGHSEDECYGWQKGIRSFCEWLDKRGIDVPDYGNLWE